MCAWTVQAERGSGAVTGLWSLSFWERSKQPRHLGPSQALSAEPQCWLMLAGSNSDPGCSPARLEQSHGTSARRDHSHPQTAQGQLRRCVKAQRRKCMCNTKVPNINILFSWLIREVEDTFPITAVSLLYLALSIKWAIEIANWVLFLTGFHPERADFLQPSPKLPLFFLLRLSWNTHITPASSFANVLSNGQSRL